MDRDRPTRRRLASALACAALLFGAVPASAMSPPPPQEVLVLFEDGHVSPHDLRGLSAAGLDPRTARRGAGGLVALVPARGRTARQALSSLAGRADLVAAPNNPMRAAMAVPPDDPYYPMQRPHLGPETAEPYAIDLEPVWQEAFSGGRYGLVDGRAPITVALVDTGVDFGAMFLDDPGVYVAGWDYVNDDADPTDDHYQRHGTRVASVMAATADNGVGTAGVAGETPMRILVYKVLDSMGSGDDLSVMSGLLAAADAGAKVINCSIAGATTDPGRVWPAVLESIRERGAVLVTAAGNGGSTSNPAVCYPAAATGAIAVGSVDAETGQRSDFSSYGPQLDLMAPGDGVWTSAKSGSYLAESGTSFAAPMVSGSLAMLWSLVPSATADYMSRVLTSTAEDLHTAGPDQQTGYGEIDVWDAYAHMVSDVPACSRPSPSVSVSGSKATIEWDPVWGATEYRYGYEGGPWEYAAQGGPTTLVFEEDGTHEVYVRALSGSRWASPDATVSVTISTGREALDFSRLEGDDRYATSVRVVGDSYPDGSDTVVLASGQNWPDALAAGPLAYSLGAPLLITEKDSLTTSVRDEVWRLSPSRVIVVGGSSAVSSQVDSQLRTLLSGVTVERVQGADRYATAYAVARRMGGYRATALVVSGENWPDALSGASMAAANGYPVLLTRRGSLPSATSSALSALHVSDTVVLGGSAAVSDAVLGSLPSPERVWGADRYATSRAAADFAVRGGLLRRASVGAATGRNFPDALSATGLLASRKGALVLVNPSDVTPLTTWLSGRGPYIDRLTVFGGMSVVSESVERSLRLAVRP